MYNEYVSDIAKNPPGKWSRSDTETYLIHPLRLCLLTPCQGSPGKTTSVPGMPSHKSPPRDERHHPAPSLGSQAVHYSRHRPILAHGDESPPKSDNHVCRVENVFLCDSQQCHHQIAFCRFAVLHMLICPGTEIHVRFRFHHFVKLTPQFIENVLCAERPLHLVIAVSPTQEVDGGLLVVVCVFDKGRDRL